MLPEVLALLVIGAFFAAVVRYSVDVPSWDDYDAVLSFSNDFLKGDWRSRLTALFSQHNEHRIVIARLWMLACLLIFKTTNFKALILLGSSSLVGLYALLRGMVPDRPGRGWARLAVALLLFSYAYWETVYMAMAALSNLWVLLFSVWALERLVKGKTVAAMILAVLATYSSGAGFCAFASGVVLLALQRRYRALAAWGTVMAAAFALYLIHYVKPIAHPDAGTAFHNPIAALIFLMASAGSNAGYFLIFLWGHSREAGFALCVLAGTVLCAFSGYLAYRRYDRRNPALFGTLLFLWMVFGTIMVSRLGFGFGAAVSSRYAVISALAMACACIACFDLGWLDRPRAMANVVWVCLFLHVFGFWMLATNRGNVLDKAMSLFVRGDSPHEYLVKPVYPNPIRAYGVLAESKRNGVYDVTRVLPNLHVETGPN
jgi:hypothetical protein